MKKFKFRLETLGRYRVLKEETAKREFADALHVWELACERLEGLRSEERRAIAGMRTALAETFSPAELQAYSDHRACLAVDIEAQQLVVEAATAFMESKREIMIEASKDRKVVDTLREKQKERYMYEVGREEQSFLDEVGGSRFLRQRAAKEGSSR